MLNKRTIEAIGALWPAWKPTPLMLAMWKALLDDLQDEEIDLAVLYHAQRSVYPPTVSEIRAAVERIDSAQGGSEHPRTPAEAWGQIERYREWAQGPCDTNKPEVVPEAWDVARDLMGANWQHSQTWAKDRAANRSRFMDAWSQEDRRCSEEAAAIRAMRALQDPSDGSLLPIASLLTLPKPRKES